MSRRVSNFTDLIQRVTASCLLHPLGDGRFNSQEGDEQEELKHENLQSSESESNTTEEENDNDEDDADPENNIIRCNTWKKDYNSKMKEKEMVELMEQVFETVSSMKKAYVSLQGAHCPWDQEKIRVADGLVVAQLKKLSVLRERFRRSFRDNDGGGGSLMSKSTGRRKRRSQQVGGVTVLREVVAPYEAVVEDLKQEVKSRNVEVQNLKEKLHSIGMESNGNGGKKVGRSQSRKKLSCSQIQVSAAPTPEIFEATMLQVKEASKTFTSLVLSLMHAAHWDITAAVRSIEAASGGVDKNSASATNITSSIASNHHAKYALESYISREIFQGFDHETFYMDGSLSSLLKPDQFRRDCFMQYRDMKSMDPTELLGILPTCHFGKFCSKKYLSIVPPKMEESLFGNLDQHQQISAGNHPRNEFYMGFLGLAKAVWLLHLLAFSLNPAPNHFEASRGAEFHPRYMESVIRFSDGRVPAGQVVGFPVGPGFKLGNGSIVKARVYLIARA